MEIIKSTTPKAKKKYACMASEFLRDAMGSIASMNPNYFGFSDEELASIEKAKANNWKILKGETYVYQFNKSDGDTYVFRAIPAIHDICCIHAFYPES